jgi:hypothetical protein
MDNPTPILLKKGSWLPLSQIVEKLRRHELSLDDFYYEKKLNRWHQLNSHPLIKKQFLPIPKHLLRSLPAATSPRG